MLIGQNVKNGFINSRFDYWQRGTSFNLIGGLYTADRALGAAFGDGGVLAPTTISRQTMTDPNFIDQPFFLRINNTTQGSSLGANSYSVLSQTVEDVRTYAGKTVTFSIWMASSYTKQIAAYSNQIFGSGGSASASSSFLNSVRTAGPAITRYDFTLNVPSVSGKIIGSGSCIQFAIFLQGGAGSLAANGVVSAAIPWGGTGNIDIYRMQVAEGPAADFQTRGESFIQELVLCQRYFEKSYDLDTPPGSITFAGNIGWSSNFGGVYLFTHGRSFAVPKRAIPSIRIYSPATGAADRIYSESSPTGDLTVGVSDVGQTAFRIWNNSVNGVYHHAHFTADAEL